ncbi:hypothetical protein R3P38DRAFT_2811043 [Favolaschia claudopus]|uniref:Uncharacterized protein n=1 Tax=Favolaschia claudopus TaxID=2862362 RepID=A0AAV9ZAL4_9AGAR
MLHLKLETKHQPQSSTAKIAQYGNREVKPALTDGIREALGSLGLPRGLQFYPSAIGVQSCNIPKLAIRFVGCFGLWRLEARNEVPWVLRLSTISESMRSDENPAGAYNKAYNSRGFFSRSKFPWSALFHRAGEIRTRGSRQYFLEFPYPIGEVK